MAGWLMCSRLAMARMSISAHVTGGLMEDSTRCTAEGWPQQDNNVSAVALQRRLVERDGWQTVARLESG